MAPGGVGLLALAAEGTRARAYVEWLSTVPAETRCTLFARLEPLADLLNVRGTVVDLVGGPQVFRDFMSMLVTVRELRCESSQNNLFDLDRDRAIPLPRTNKTAGNDHFL